jgi:hypothetical protein
MATTGGGGVCPFEYMEVEGELDSLALTSAVVDGNEQRVKDLILGTTTSSSTMQCAPLADKKSDCFFCCWLLLLHATTTRRQV